MDVYKALRELYEEKKRLDSAISALEARLRILSNTGVPTRSRRGRHFMSPEERQEVSRRMSRYWASRRANRHQGAETGIHLNTAEVGAASPGAIREVA